MKLTASTDGNPRYFSAKLGWKERFDPKEVNILIAGAVPQLIPPEAVQGRRNNIMRYNISPYSTLDCYLSYILSREQFAELLLQCIQLFRQTQRLYLNYKNLVLELEHIYVLLSDRSLHFIFLPLVNSTREASIPDFFRKLLRKASRSTYEQSAFLDGCLAWLDRPVPFALDEFETFVRDSARLSTNMSAPQAASIHPEEMFGNRERPVVRLQTDFPSGQNVLSDDSSHDTAFLQASAGGTTLLADPPRPRFFLTRVCTGERVEIARSPFLVGTEAGNVAYCVSGNTAVSRRHAEFNIQEGLCLVSDQKSTNKTYVNDCALEPFQPRALTDGDRVTLANEVFTFNQEE